MNGLIDEKIYNDLLEKYVEITQKNERLKKQIEEYKKLLEPFLDNDSGNYTLEQMK